MWSRLCNYIYDKCFYKPAVGQKRKNVDHSEYPPGKHMKLESGEIVSNDNIAYNFISNMNNEDNSGIDEEEYCVSEEVFPRTWGSSYSMARQSIHENKYNFDNSTFVDKRKSDSISTSTNNKNSSHDFNDLSEVEVVKYVTKNSTHTSKKLLKNKPSNSKLFTFYQPSNSRQNMDSSKTSTFQGGIKKNLNFLQESYRLSEKIQYMQLLQQQTTKFNNILAPFTIKSIGSRKENQSSIPVIDLTKEKNNVFIDRSREKIPWIASSRSNESLSISDDSSGSKEVSKVNSLQEILKTHPVTEKSIVDEILSRHASETAEKRRQVEIEKAKLKVLTVSNRKAYIDALEEKMRQYMRITTPALKELEPEKDKYVLPKIDKEQEARISSLLIPSPSGEILVEKFGLQIKRRDLQTLKGLNWLNDEIINFYMNLIIERSKKEELPNIYAFNTFFYPKLISSGHASLRRWTKKVDIFSQDLVLVPIHLGMHWCMAVIDFRSKEVRYYDSMGSCNNRCLQSLLSYLEAESLDKKKVTYNTKDWVKINVENIPQQMNGSDCGVFSCVFAEHIARNAPLLFSQDNMPYFRKKMTLEIVDGKLMT